jgi:hypothetical protein
MARFDDDDELDTTGLREYLLARAIEFREILAHPIRPGHNGQPVLDEHGEPQRYPLNAELWELLTPHTLAAGGAYRFERGYLPDGHFALSIGGRNDTLELGADDVLRLVVD